MTESSTPADGPPPPWRVEPEIVCGHCGHAFRMPETALGANAVALKCPACRKAFQMNQAFAHDAVEELDKRRHTNPIDQVLADLGRVLGS